MNSTYTAQSKSLFGVPIVAKKVRVLFGQRGIAVKHEHVLKSVDAARKTAKFTTPDGEVELGYDFLNVIPPQRAPDVIRNTDLPWSDKWVDQGWMEVDQKTLRHARYPEIFAMADVAGVPKGKTAASVKWHQPVVEDHLIVQIQGREGTEVFTGYTSCRLITKVGRAMLIAFDYKDKLVESFAGIAAPYLFVLIRDRRVSWGKFLLA